MMHRPWSVTAVPGITNSPGGFGPAMPHVLSPADPAARPRRRTIALPALEPGNGFVTGQPCEEIP